MRKSLTDAKTIFSWPKGGVFERINDRIKAQIERVEELTGDMDPKTNFALIIIQTELERYKFLVRSYLRARLAKVVPPSSICVPGYRVVADAESLDRQAYALLFIRCRAKGSAVTDRAGLRDEAPSSTSQSLPFVLPSFIPTAAPKPQ